MSPTTVSHVLSGNRPVSEQAKARVRTAMSDLGYVPSRAARNLALGSSRTVGLLVPDIRNSFFADLAKGAEQTCIERGFNLLLCNTGWNMERELSYLETLKSRAVDGVVFASGAPAAASQLADLLAGLPLVAVDEDLPGTAPAIVVSDNIAGGRLAGKHLIALGHKSAAIVGANPSLATSRHRVAGFKNAWRRATGHVPVVLEGTFEEDSGYEVAGALIPRIRAGSITAVFAVNDLCALGVLRRLREERIAVPAECSVVGFDDIYTARHANPALTTVRQDAVEMGARAAQVLLDELGRKGESPRGRTVLPVRLVERQSTAPLVNER